MADEKKFGEGEEPFDDSGLGNLPPLSDFDSQGGFGSDTDSLPPLSGFDGGDSGGLPPLSDVESETPVPQFPPGPGRGAPSFSSQGSPMDFDSGPTAIDTPAPGRLQTPGGGFQDMAADSDFSPETPEIGAGPDSNVDTPMFDSAFGGGDQDFDMAANTPAPTQAMETPMFGGGGGRDDSGFGAFGGGMVGGAAAGGGDFGFEDNAFAGGTPAPDFSPDTEMRRQGGSAFPEPPAAGPPAKKRGGGAALAIVGLVALFIGVVAAPFLAPYLTFLPNPVASELERAQEQIRAKDEQIAELRQMTDRGVEQISPEELDRLTAEIGTASAQLAEINAQLEASATQLAARQEELALVEEDLAAKSEEYALAQQAYEDLQNEMAIIQARQRGLASEVERLTNLVGDLEDANARRAATKDALQHNVERLLIQVRESLPLTPEKYSHADRIAKVEALREKVVDAKWVTPELVEEYTNIYLAELEIGQREEYFFAKMPVLDQFGNQTQKWAETLMLGNRAVYFRTLDGRNIGLYTNTGTAESPRWTVEEVFDKELRQGIEARVFQSRVPGFEEKIQFLAERELSEEEGTAFQRAFGSL